MHIGIGIGLGFGQASRVVAPGPTSQVTMFPLTLSLTADAPTATVHAAARDADNHQTGDAVTYASSAPSVVTVNATTGLCTQVGLGTANITASSGLFTSSACVVTASIGVTSSVVLSPSTLTVSSGSPGTVSATTTDVAGNDTGATVTYHTSNAAIATVDSSGQVARVSDGSASITATADGVTSNACAVTAVASGPTTHITDTPSSISGSIGDSGTVSGVAKDEDENPTGDTIYWVSSDEGVAAISPTTGDYIFVGNGSAVFYPQLTNPVTDVGPTTNITDAPSSISGSIGDTGTATGIARDEDGNATGDTIYWESLDESIVTIVAETGVWTLVANGSAVIRPRLTPPFTPLVAPTFDTERFVTIKRMDADNYATIDDLFTDGFDNGGFGTGAEVDTHVLGLPSQILLDETHDSRADGHAVRLRYFGVSDLAYGAGYNEAHAVGFNLPGGDFEGSPGGTPEHPLVLDYWRRIMYRGTTDGTTGQVGGPTEGTPPTIGGTPHLNTDDPTAHPPVPNGQSIQMKANEFWVATRAHIVGVQKGRTQVCFSYTPEGRVSNDIPYPGIGGVNGSINEVVSEREHNPVEGLTGVFTEFFASQQSSPFPYEVDAQWHHVQILLATNSTPVSDDGYCMVYINGILVIAIHPDYVDVLNPDSVVAGQVGPDTRWCTISDIRRLYAAYAPDDGYGGYDTGGHVGFRRVSIGVVANNFPSAAIDVDIDKEHIYMKR